MLTIIQWLGHRDVYTHQRGILPSAVKSGPQAPENSGLIVELFGRGGLHSTADITAHHGGQSQSQTILSSSSPFSYFADNK